MDDLETENDTVVTVSEFIDGIEAQELEADLVLGGDEGKECTYEKGYMPRQAVFSCLTCTSGGNAGFCTACSLTCHDGHEVVELWTRRCFRCDCGNEKFGDFECKLYKEKESVNNANVYNQNYGGLYCSCHRPFPDPDGIDQGEMLQCCICEDWFHETHLGLTISQQVPRDEDGEPTFDELICPFCVSRCSFLSQYPQLIMPPIQAEGTNEVLQVEIVVNPPSTRSEESNTKTLIDDIKAELPVPFIAHSSSSETEMLREAPLGPKVPTDLVVGESSGAGVSLCKLKQEALLQPHHLEGDQMNDKLERPLERKGLHAGTAIFLSKDWRNHLCMCEACLAMYNVKGVGYLLEKEDTLHEYEETAKKKREEQKEKVEGAGRDFLQKLGHVQCMELLHGVNDLASELGSFLTPFGETGKTVTSADIYEFFDKLTQKRRRLS